MTWTFHEGELDRDDVRALLAEHFAEMRAGSPPQACHVLPVESLAAPNIRFLSVRDEEGQLLGVGALKALDGGHGEIKSMRTATEARGTGAGRAMLDQLLGMAEASGMMRVSLETGNSDAFVPANRLYVSAGFERCGPFGGYADTPFTLFYTLTL